MERHYPALALFAFLFLNPLMLVLVPFPEWGALSVYFLVITVAGVLLYQRGIKPVDPRFPAALFLLALLAKLLGSLVRYWTVVDLYDNAADAPYYYQSAQFVAGYFKLLDFSIIDTAQFRGAGTTSLVHIIGLLYSVLPASMAGGFFIFATLAFAGSVFFYRSVRIAWPDAPSKVYLLFVFFLPSILFWPSSLGKDAWIFFNSGLVMLGWVLFVRRGRLLGLLWIAAGLLLINPVRAHVAAFLAIAMGAAYLLYGTRSRNSLISWLAGAIAVGVLALYMFQSGANYLELSEMSLESVQEFYTAQQAQTTVGGSRYQTVNAFSPSGLVVGLVTALARPFPWEAGNVQALVASLETMAWLIFCWMHRHTFWSKVRHMRSDPVVGFAFFYTLIMLAALTSIGNFGIIARQRVMLLPFFWMLFI